MGAEGAPAEGLWTIGGTVKPASFWLPGISANTAFMRISSKEQGAPLRTLIYGIPHITPATGASIFQTKLGLALFEMDFPALFFCGVFTGSM